jgi:hypothetical protein
MKKKVLIDEPVPSVAFDQQWDIDINASTVEESGIKPNC